MGCHLGQKVIVCNSNSVEASVIQNHLDLEAQYKEKPLDLNNHQVKKNSSKANLRNFKSPTSSKKASVLSREKTSTSFLNHYGYLVKVPVQSDEGVKITFLLKSLFSEQLIPIKLHRNKQVIVEIEFLTCYQTIIQNKTEQLPSFQIKVLGAPPVPLEPGVSLTFNKTGLLAIKLAPCNSQEVSSQAIVQFKFLKAKLHDSASELKMQGVMIDDFDSDHLLVLGRIAEFRELPKDFYLSHFAGENLDNFEKWMIDYKVPNLEMDSNLNTIAKQMYPTLKRNNFIEKEVKESLVGKLANYSNLKYFASTNEESEGLHAFLQKLFTEDKFVQILLDGEIATYGFHYAINKFGEETLFFIFFGSVEFYS